VHNNPFTTPDKTTCPGRSQDTNNNKLQEQLNTREVHSPDAEAWGRICGQSCKQTNWVERRLRRRHRAVGTTSRQPCDPAHTHTHSTESWTTSPHAEPGLLHDGWPHRRHTVSVRNQSPSPTQPPTLSGMGNEYQAKCGDAVDRT